MMSQTAITMFGIGGIAGGVGLITLAVSVARLRREVNELKNGQE